MPYRVIDAMMEAILKKPVARKRPSVGCVMDVLSVLGYLEKRKMMAQVMRTKMMMSKM